jgi:hypothetical protein
MGMSSLSFWCGFVRGVIEEGEKGRRWGGVVSKLEGMRKLRVLGEGEGKRGMEMGIEMEIVRR